MGVLGRFFSKKAADKAASSAIEVMLEQQRLLGGETSDNFDPERFMASVKAVTESEDVTKVCAHVKDNGFRDDDYSSRVLNELRIFVTNSANMAGVAKKARKQTQQAFLEHFVSNPNVRFVAEQYPSSALIVARSLCYEMQGQEGIKALAVLERDGTFFANIIRNAEKTNAADFFLHIREGLPDNVAVARFRLSPSFQAAFQAKDGRVFMDFLSERDPVLLSAIDPNSKPGHTLG